MSRLRSARRPAFPIENPAQEGYGGWEVVCVVCRSVRAQALPNRLQAATRRSGATLPPKAGATGNGQLILPPAPTPGEFQRSDHAVSRRKGKTVASKSSITYRGRFEN